jgi:hypothetical protein
MKFRHALIIVVAITSLLACGSYRHLRPVDEDAGRWVALDESPRPRRADDARRNDASNATTSTPVAVEAPSASMKAASGARIAVLEITGGNLDIALLRLLSDGLRAQALRVVKSRGMTVMTRESMLAILSDMGACTTPEEGTCEVETGRNIGADILVTGEITKVGAQYFLTLKLFDVRSGSLLSTRSLRAKDGVGLVDAIETEGATLFTEGLSD